MALIDLDLNPPPRKLAVFGLTWTVFFGMMAAVAWARSSSPTTGWWLAGVAIAPPAAGAVFRPILRWLYVGTSVVTFPIGWVISKILLAVTFYLVFTPIGLLLRAAGHDAMQRHFDRDAETYWEPHPKASAKRRYFRQY